MAKNGKASAEAKLEKNCKACGSKLKKMLFDSRHKDFSVLVCNDISCTLYRQFQATKGKPPEGVSLRVV